MIKEIKEGDIFICKEDFFMEDGEKSYTKGNKYTSDTEGSIVDDQQESHWFFDDDMNNIDSIIVNQYFKRYS